MYRQVGVVSNAHRDALSSVAWTNSNVIVSGGVDHSIRFWDPNSLSKQKSTTSAVDSSTPSVRPTAVYDDLSLGVVSVAASADGKLVGATTLDSMIHVYDITAEANETSDEKGSDGNAEAAADATGDSGVFGTQHSKSIEAEAADVWSLAFLSGTESPVVVTGTHGGNVNLWDLENGEKKASFKGDGKFTLSVACSPNGSMIAAGDSTGIISLFDVATGAKVHSLSGHSKGVRGVAFSSDGAMLATASQDECINLYEVKTGEQIATLSGHLSWVLSVAFNPQTAQFASSSADKRIKVWDIGTREVLHTFDAHSDQVWGVAYNPSGTQLVSGSDDSSLRVYDAHEK
jgi:WD repeat-containing protein 61